MRDVVTPEILLRAYAYGIFPMSEDKDDDTLFWVDPDERGIIPLSSFRISKSLKKIIRQNKFTVTVDTAFQEVMKGCANPAKDREITWISGRIEDLYYDLFKQGNAHSVECWLDDKLVGGLYGVCMNGAFFGESMFHTVTDASKVALAHLVARMIDKGFSLLDTQFVTDHLKQFGAIEISRDDYHSKLNHALKQNDVIFDADNPATYSGELVLQLITQTS
ncbi:leucyl/phenylalanyl-tRNA--protein transferase [Kordiimonas sp. SCSIO 12610]|uniref:leucyl/phenylalanyl-tRNA--protein transferase n=1 Tax=Kordiimonas sp. SCSIO 12610 TaxID=2829597 RepID=UPI00210D9C0E|nr:leucyl/phenylalanyl-tRNA--protein transferase [Kordiimonas sp. SCSIO 12610]UTW53836.1 leucyl/phenylalanyl-tRNA--protein transferase [Kordiimonas sp. SCSIO 12610]